MRPGNHKLNGVSTFMLKWNHLIFSNTPGPSSLQGLRVCFPAPHFCLHNSYLCFYSYTFMQKIFQFWGSSHSPILFPIIYVPVINLLSISSKTTLLCPTLWYWRWTYKHFFFASQYNVKFCQQRALKGHSHNSRMKTLPQGSSPPFFTSARHPSGPQKAVEQLTYIPRAWSPNLTILPSFFAVSYLCVPVIAKPS